MSRLRVKETRSLGKVSSKRESKREKTFRKIPNAMVGLRQERRT